MNERNTPRRRGMLPSLGSLNLVKAHGFEPDYFAPTIEDIDFALLKKRGVKYLVLDVDHTLVPYQAMTLDAKTQVYLNTVQRKYGIERIYLASNSGRDLTAIATSINARSIPSTLFRRKPHKVFFMKVLATIGCEPHQTAMVGDKLILDVWGANRVGMITILVDPIGPDMLLDRILLRRFWKNWFIRHSQTEKRAKA